MQEFTSLSNGLRMDWAVLRDLEKFLCKCHPGHHLLSFSPKALEGFFLLAAFFWLSPIAAPLHSGPWQSWPVTQHLSRCPLKQRSRVADSHKQRSPCCLCWVLPLVSSPLLTMPFVPTVSPAGSPSCCSRMVIELSFLCRVLISVVFALWRETAPS